MSDDAPAIDEALVRRLIAAQFPQWAGLPVEKVVPGGWNNVTFRLGLDMLARLPRHEAYVSQIAKEQQWLPVLAAGLPVAIPAPVALGRPSDLFPWPWSVYRWIAGETALDAPMDKAALGVALGGFLQALYQIDTADGPPPGPHNFYRGGPLETYDAQTRQAIAALGDSDQAAASARIWDAALTAVWRDTPTWLHGDFSPANILIEGGRLAAVIDFGGVGVGDPACDLAIAWTFLGAEGHAAMKAAVGLDDGAWARGRGWALWKALILYTGIVDGHPRDVAASGRVLAEVLARP